MAFSIRGSKVSTVPATRRSTIGRQDYDTKISWQTRGCYKLEGDALFSLFPNVLHKEDI